MKTTCWLIFAAMLTTRLLAADSPAGTSNTAPVASPKEAAKKETAAASKKDAASQLRTVPLVPGPATVDANNVNVRGQAKLKSEVVARLTKGQVVTVLEEITRKNTPPDEPSAWAKILLPANTHVWVNNSFIDPSTKAVVPRRLNMRSGPGENFSILGRMERGDTVTDAGGVKDGWLEILAPTNAYAFVAAQYLKQEAAVPTPEVAATTPATPTEPPVTPSTVAEPPPVAAAPTEPPATAPTEPSATVTNPVPEVATSVPSTNEPAADEPPPKRIVQRQGVVRGTVSIQAPTRFGLHSIDTGRLINYLYTTSPSLDLSRYKGLQIIVTGEEGMEERWASTPVITIQKILVVE